MNRPIPTNTKEWDGGSLPQPNVPYKNGYDVDTTKLQASEKGFNALLMDDADSTHVKLHVVGVTTGFTLAGSTAHSQLTRDFYARNFEQPSYAIECQAPSQWHYGRIAEFVRKAQKNAVTQDALMVLSIPRGGLRNTANGVNSGRPSMRGVHDGLTLQGYVADMPRIHRRHEPAPSYQFSFVVARTVKGPFKEQIAAVHRAPKWSELVDMFRDDHNFVEPGEIKTLQQQALENAVNTVQATLGELLGFLSDDDG